jgi:transposase-like protein
MLDLSQRHINSALRKVIKRIHRPLEVILICVSRYAAYPFSLRDIKEMMQEHSAFVDHFRVYQ